MRIVGRRRMRMRMRIREAMLGLWLSRGLCVLDVESYLELEVRSSRFGSPTSDRRSFVPGSGR